MIDRTGNKFSSNISKSLGVSRKNMNPEFIDKILNEEIKKDEGNPAPGDYHNHFNWQHEVSHSVREKAAPLFSMPGRDSHLNKHLDRMGDLPGPGCHGASMVAPEPKTKVFAPVRSMQRNSHGVSWMEDGRGNDESKRQNINKMQSALTCNGSYSFGRAQDRFNVPT